MTQFDRALTGFRFVQTQRGDTMQLLAVRELGDAARWVDLVNLNNLLPPFITDDPAQVAPGVILTGKQILVPAPIAAVTTTVDPDEVFGTDVMLGPDGALLTDGLDFLPISGRDNLSQALKNRIETELEELMYRPQYGCDVRRIVGIANGPTAGLLGERAVKRSLAQEDRVSLVMSATADISGDSIDITATVDTVAGVPLQVQATP